MMSFTCDVDTWKVCTGCGIEKPLVNFHKSAKSPAYVMRWDSCELEAGVF